MAQPAGPGRDIVVAHNARRVAGEQRDELEAALAAGAGGATWTTTIVREKARALLEALARVDPTYTDICNRLVEVTSQLRRYVWAWHMAQGLIATYAPKVPAREQERLQADIAKLMAMEPASAMAAGLARLVAERDDARRERDEANALLDASQERAADLLAIVRAVGGPEPVDNGAAGPVAPPAEPEPARTGRKTRRLAEVV
jgi:hypothetical protein